MVNIYKSKNQTGVVPKKGEGNKEARVISLEGTQETTKSKETNEIRDDSNDAKEKSNNGESKDSKAILSHHHAKDQDEGAAVIKEGESMGKPEEDTDSEEEEEEEGEIELTTPRKKENQRKEIQKEVREQATYNDKLQGSQLTLEKLLKNTRNTRQHGHAQKGMPMASKSK